MKLPSLLILVLFISLRIMAQPDSIKTLYAKSAASNISASERANAQLEIAEFLFIQKGALDSAITFYKKAATSYDNSKNLKQKAYCYQRIGYLNFKMNNEQKVMAYTDTAIKICEKIKFNKGIAGALMIQATVGTQAEKISTLYKVITIAKKENDKPTLGDAMNNIGSMYTNINDDSALHYYTKAYNLSKDYLKLKPYAAFNRGDALRRKKKYAQAEQFINEALTLFKKSNKRPSVGWVIPELVKLHLEWKRDKPNEYEAKATKINLLGQLNISREIAQTSKDFNFILSLNEAYKLYFGTYQNKDSVIKYQRNIIVLKDSMAQVKKIKATAKYATQLKTANKEREIIKLNADKKIASATANRNKIIFLLILLGILSSIYFIVRRIKQRNLIEQEERDKNFRSKLSSDLHDDVGTILTSLSMQSELLEMKASEGNKGTVSKIANMSRDATRRMRDTVWAIDSRKDNIMDLAYRMIDFAEDILEPKDVEFQLAHNIEGKDDKISAELRQNIFLIFKEAITNTAKYGTGELVTSALQKENDNLYLSISNQTDKEIKIAEVSGLGLSNIKKRSEELNGKFEIKNEKNQFILNLSFPL
jgi:signal transduction histidine kinase